LSLREMIFNHFVAISSNFTCSIDCCCFLATGWIFVFRLDTTYSIHDTRYDFKKLERNAFYGILENWKDARMVDK